MIDNTFWRYFESNVAAIKPAFKILIAEMRGYVINVHSPDYVSVNVKKKRKTHSLVENT